MARRVLRAPVVLRTAWGEDFSGVERDWRPGTERDSQALVFASLADELAERLDAHRLQVADEEGQTRAAALAARGRDLASRFRATANALSPVASRDVQRDEVDGPPSLVGELIDFHRAALDVLGDAR